MAASVTFSVASVVPNVWNFSCYVTVITICVAIVVPSVAGFNPDFAANVTDFIFTIGVNVIAWCSFFAANVTICVASVVVNVITWRACALGINREAIHRKQFNKDKHQQQHEAHEADQEATT